MGDIAGTRMEGWVYYLSSSKLRLNHPRKRYLVLEGIRASSFKDKPRTGVEILVRSGIIDPDTRVIDHGRETVHGRIGVQNAEDAAKWMHAFREAAERAQPPGTNKTFLPSPPGRRRLPNLRRSGRKGSGLFRDVSGVSDALGGEDCVVTLEAVNHWTGGLLTKDASPDVVASSPWQIIGCKNGLRFFQETSDGDESLLEKIRGDDIPTLMAVGVVDATPASVFETAMALGRSRAEWDFCFHQGRVIENVHGHTDIIHEQFHSRWLPWRMKPRDLVFQRYWRRDDDGTYVILYNSINHEKCPPGRKFTRAWLHSGGFVISPLKGRKDKVKWCMVKHIMKVDWKGWEFLWRKSRNRDMSLIMLERIAAIRELYKVKEKPIISMKKEHHQRHEDIFYESAEPKPESEDESSNRDRVSNQPSLKESTSKFIEVADDEFFDAEEPTSWERGEDPELKFYEELEGSSMDEVEQKAHNLPAPQKAVSKAATIVKRIQDLASGPRHPSFSRSLRKLADEADVEFMNRESSLGSVYWEPAEPGTFLIRGKHFLRDHKKVKAGTPLMQLVAADWFKSDKREDHIAAHDGCVIQKLFAKQKNAHEVADSYFVIINLQVPGTPTYSLVLYYMTNKRLQDIPLLENFVRGDNRYRACRFKLCPYVAKGPWIVKQSVGKSACLVGEALDITYFSSDNYLELDIDIGSSSVARGVVNLVTGYVTKLVIEMAFLIQANTEEELPEKLLGTVRISNLDMQKAVLPPPEY
ncbi:protein ENHANCED DISEASE RESISTANCE 2-like isoform X2 [Physcomitrium patens]|uniref:protein ENHANCED DISEASE RESISTANCE 2-like isoform X2 n=1 Tax=Physcomitrium patens TaxID=3218 RepID=UPI003CCDC58C